MVVPRLRVPVEHAAELLRVEVREAAPNVQRQLVEQVRCLVAHAPKSPERIRDVLAVEQVHSLQQLLLGRAQQRLARVVAQAGNRPQAVDELLRGSGWLV